MHDDVRGPIGPGGHGTDASPRRETRQLGKIFAIVAIVVLVIGLGAGALYYTSRPNSPSYKIGACVVHSGDSVVASSCSAPGSFKIVSKVTDPSACPDTKNPYVSVNNNKTIYCLAPNQPSQPSNE